MHRSIATRNSRAIPKLVTERQLELATALMDFSRREIIEILNKRPEGAIASELAKELGLKVSTVMSHLKILEKVGAVEWSKRSGKNVKRPLKYYYSLVRLGTLKEIEEEVEKVQDEFREHVISSTHGFLMENPNLLPDFTNPFAFAKWIDALFSEALFEIGFNTVFIENDVLAEMSEYRKVATLAAKVLLFDGFTYLLWSYIYDLFKKKSDVVRNLAKALGKPDIKSIEDITFVLDATFAFLYRDDSGREEALTEIQKMLEVLPKRKRSRLQKLLPYFITVKDLPEEIRDEMGKPLLLFLDEKGIEEFCKVNVRTIDRFGE